MKNDLRIAVTKRMIKEGLCQLLERKPLEKIKVNELCEKAGVNRATFYRHYSAPQDVLCEIETDFLAQVPKFSGPPQNLEEARAHMEVICSYFYEHSDVAALLFRSKTDEDMMRGMDQIYRAFLDLRDKEKQCCHMDDDTARILIALIGGGCHCLLRQWILEKIPKTPQEIASIMCNVIRWPDVKDTV